MPTKVYFENIQPEILNVLNKAEHSIYVAVAWITDEEILNLLCKKAEQGVDVSVLTMDDEINLKNRPWLNRLLINNASVYSVPHSGRGVMHNKFSVIDEDTVISGSYNWTRQAAHQNKENITITYGDPTIAAEYINNFNSIAEQFVNIYFENAKYFHKLGLNITCISDQENEFNKSAINTYLKAPNHKWEHLISERQSWSELISYPWHESIGLGVVTGYAGLLVVDIDNGSYDFLVQMLIKLSLPLDYEWVVETGSRQGYHIYIFVDDITELYPEATLVRQFPKHQYSAMVKKVEFLLKLHSILPPSIHPTQSLYQFMNCSAKSNKKPSSLPLKVSDYHFQECLSDLFDLSQEVRTQDYRKTFFKGRLKQFVKGVFSGLMPE